LRKFHNLQRLRSGARERDGRRIGISIFGRPKRASEIVRTQVTMKYATILIFFAVAAALAGCDMRSGTAKEEMEKFSGTPTPTISPTPTETPIDPSEIVQADLSLDGDKIRMNGYGQKRSVACAKLNRVMVSGGQNVITVTGACRQIMVNGNGNQITSDASIEIVMNGDGNTVYYSRYVNGKRPIITDNAGGNTIEKIAATGAKIESNQRKR